MRAIYKKPGAYPDTIEIDSTLETLQMKVGGPIEVVTLSPDTCVICNEEGRIRRMAPNVTLDGINFVGPILVVGTDREEFCSLKFIGFWMDVIRNNMSWGGRP